MTREKKKRGISLSALSTLMMISVVVLGILGGLIVFLKVYSQSMTENAVITSEQAVTQVVATVENYTTDMGEIMDLIRNRYETQEQDNEEFFQNLFLIRSDMVAVTVYDENGNLLEAHLGSQMLKDPVYRNLSYCPQDYQKDNQLHVSQPHVETILENYYPWVVTISEQIETKSGKQYYVAMDIRFSEIMNYVDKVGIGQHGYCFIMDTEGNIIYHPQQQLIYSGLKKQDTNELTTKDDGTSVDREVIYSMSTLENCNWRVVGVSYMDELVTIKMESIIGILVFLLLIVILTSSVAGLVLCKLISRPVQKLIHAMKNFEKDASRFTYDTITGTEEISALSDSFGHMVLRIQELMEQVRNEEISLRKTELKALQAQINPHFLYNTLDAIGWLCEEERNQDAVEMVNALARLFRISISKGHELITIEKELEHAQSYLQIEKFRYKKFEYDFEVDEKCLGYYCNKITLQPIIENAIYHGLNSMVDEGKITIRIKEEEENIVFYVEDNGVGMTAEQCEMILSKEANDRTGIGIKNVNDRIKIYFGEQYGLTVTSELDEGTCVRICMPKVEEGDQK